MDLKRMLPFLEEEQLNELLKKIEESDTREFKGISLSTILPFLDEDIIDETFLNRVKNNQEYNELLPFVSEDALHKLVVEYSEDKIDINFDSIYPFLDEDDIKLLFNKLMDK